MSLKARTCHEILELYYSFSKKRFFSAKTSLEKAQRKKLRELISFLKKAQHWAHLNEDMTYEQLSSLIPVSDYSNFKKIIETQRTKKEDLLTCEIQRYEPTSGSTEARKWIPYSKKFLSEINEAAMAWMGDIYTRFPHVKQGVHYWSLSWMPEELRSQATSNDADLFPFYQRWILKNSMAVSPKIAFIKNPEAAWWATLISLVGREDLTLVSVWSPTFWLKIADDVKIHWDQIQTFLTQGCWGKFEEELLSELGPSPQRDFSNIKVSDEGFYKKIWPNLCLISAWDSSSSSSWAEKIQKDFVGVSFQGKGLWATEGVVTIPFAGKKVLSYQSHFYEFKDLSSGQIFPSWNLKLEGVYQPILWNATGLLRYALPDRLKVVDYFGDVPCFEFQGRLQGTDLVGEKLDSKWVLELFHQNRDWEAITLVAVRKPHPRYVLFFCGTVPLDIEKELQTFHHYKVARELGQLGPAESVLIKDVFTLWEQIGKSRLIGQNKIEVLQEIEQL